MAWSSRLIMICQCFNHNHVLACSHFSVHMIVSLMNVSLLQRQEMSHRPDIIGVSGICFSKVMRVIPKMLKWQMMTVQVDSR